MKTEHGQQLRTGGPGSTRRAAIWMWPVVQALSGCLILTGPAEGADGSLRQYVEQGRQAYARGDYATAVEAYSQAQELADQSPELAYNLGAALYKQGDLAKAKEQFLKALSTDDAGLETRAKFNLGNVCYSQALEKRAVVPEAMKLLETAIAHYRDALDVSRDDDDARTNIEMAYRLIKQLEQQQQKQQQQDNQNKQQEDKDKQDKEQPQSQPSSDQKQQEKDQQDKQQDSQKQEDPQEKKDQDESKAQNNQKDQQAQQQSGDQQESAPQPVQVKPLSQEEAERLLQSVRDRERERREKLKARMRATRVEVKRDW